MASSSLSTQNRLLKTVCSRLDPSSSAELPFVASALAANLSLCRELLSNSDEQLKKLPSNAYATVQRFRAKITSFLQGKNDKQKLAAVCLIKATVHIGGYEALAKCGHWIRGLIGIINSRLSCQKQLAILTIVSIYRATQGLPNLAREITTPTLPSFISTCINAINVKQKESEEGKLVTDNALISSVLEAFSILVPHHPATFRPFVSQLNAIVGPLIAPSELHGYALSYSGTSKVHAHAQRLFALLPRCAAKSEDGSKGKWLNRLLLLNQHALHTAEEVYRAITLRHKKVADTFGLQYFPSSKSRPEDPPSGEILDDLKLQKWQGLGTGVARLVGILQTIEAFVATKGNETYSLPVSTLIATCQSLLEPFPGQRLDALTSTDRKPEYVSEELDELFLNVASIQTAVIQLLARMLVRLGPINKSLVNGVLEDLLWRFGDGIKSLSLRASYYDLIRQCLEHNGPSTTKNGGSQLERVIAAACKDIYSDSIASENTRESGNGFKRLDADAFLKSTKDFRDSHDQAVRKSGAHLVECSLRQVPASSFSTATRTLLDRATILCRHHDAMLASAFNTPVQQIATRNWASNVPFLAREFPSSLIVEGLVRPRLPVIVSNVEVANHQSGSVAPEQFEAVAPSRNQPGYSFSDSVPVEHMDYSRDESPTTTAPTAPTAPKDNEYDMSLETGNVPKSLVEKNMEGLTNFQVAASTTGKADDPTTRVLQRDDQPLSPKRARVNDDDDTAFRFTSEEAKRVKLATFEAAPGPTSVSIIESEIGGNILPSSKINDDDDDSDDSEIPPIVFDSDG